MIQIYINTTGNYKNIHFVDGDLSTVNFTSMQIVKNFATVNQWWKSVTINWLSNLIKCYKSWQFLWNHFDFYLLGKLQGEYHKNETLKTIYVYIYIYIERERDCVCVFIMFYFWDTHLEVSLISMNMYHQTNYACVRQITLIYAMMVKFS